MTLRILLAPWLMLVAVPADAQVAGREWGATEAAQQAAKLCKVQPTFVSVSKGADGLSRVQVSPSLTPAQVSCIQVMLNNLGIYARK